MAFKPILVAAAVLVASAAAPREAPPAPPLWRVADDDSALYLFASIGAVPKGADWRSRAVATAIDAAETLWFEAPTGDPAAIARANEIFVEEGKLKSGALSARLGNDAGRLAEIAAAAGLDPAALEPLRPWAAFVLLSARIDADRDGVDAALMREAESRGKPMRYFDTIDAALGRLTALAPDDERALLVQLLGDFSRQRAGADAAYAAWRAGDLDALDAALNAPLRDGAPAIHDLLVADRTEALAAAAAQILNGRGTSFAALSARYFIGAGGLPERLQAMGFEVARVGAL